jgi:DNA-binding Lrp family transcriptional regulator
MQPLDARDLQLLDRWQRGFPLLPAPFAAVAREEGREEADILAALARLGEIGVLSRVGAVVRPNTAGASLLAAMRVAPDQLERVAAIVNAEPGVNHNYEREHAFNLWFVVTAEDKAARDAALSRLRTATCHDILELPLLESYYIDLGFRLAAAPTVERKPVLTEQPSRAEQEISAADRRLIGALDAGLPLVSRPYAALAAMLGVGEEHVIERLASLVEAGVIARLGLVVRHRPLGFTANAMAVWDVPDEHVARVGALLAAEPCVTLCYRRPRRRPDWRYNLFCMVHGRERAAVAAEIERLTQRAGLGDCASAVLFSRRCFRQRGARLQRSEARMVS